MTTQTALQNVKKLLTRHGQSHLLAFWSHLNRTQKQLLLQQIQSLDFSKVDDWVRKYVTEPAPPPVPTHFTPAPAYDPAPGNSQQRTKYDQAVKLGAQLISAGKVAAFVVAGGQGTRLGIDEPKGNFPITPLKNKTLFQVFAENIAATSKKYKTTCPWYVMTSPLNYDQTIKIFRSNNFYGLDQKNVFIFQQGTLPNFSFDGKILLADKDKIACSPDGHGGSLKALYKSGAIEDMKNRGVELISYFQVDNPLIKIFDPLFIGLHALDKAKISSKAVIKAHPLEKVGNFCLVDGRITVIEYSDLPEDQANKKNPDGSLAFQLGSIAIHIINTSFVEKLNADGFSLPLHKAVKKIPHIDLDANPVEPTEPNGIKLESFVFDALPLASKSIILKTLREEEFAPVKNASGPDSPDSAKRLIIARAANWLQAAGVIVPRKPDGSPDCTIEIAPSFALQPDDIKQKLHHIPEIKPGDTLYLE